MWGHIDCEDPEPKKKGDPKAYKEQHLIDQSVVLFLNPIHSFTHYHLVQFASAKETWDYLTKHYMRSGHAREFHLI